MSDLVVGPVYDRLMSCLRKSESFEDLLGLRTLQVKLAMLLADLYPEAEGFKRDLMEMSKLTLQLARVEAEMPTQPNPIIVRQQAAKQLMRELGSVLSIEEQRVMGEMIQVAATRLAAQNGVSASPESIAVDDFGIRQEATPCALSEHPW